MKFRKLLDASLVEELAESKVLKVKTKCPEKWLLIDLETGERYTGRVTEGTNDWKKVDTCRTLT